MTLPTGTRRTKSNKASKPCAFTLIELILVMAILLIALSVVAPSLSGFFKGRTLDSEAHRMVALTRFGQSRAVSEGVPMLLWFDKVERTYGLKQESSYAEKDSRESVFDLGKDLEVELEYARQTTRVDRRSPFGGNLNLGGGMLNSGGQNALPAIRFLPDGFIAESSPESIWIREGTRDSIWITRSRNRLNYEIQTNRLLYPVR